MLILLQIAIALMLVYMLMGLLATSVQETIAQMLKLRGKLLRDTLKKMLSGKADDGLFDKVYGHALVGGSPVAKYPAYVSAADFSMALIDTLADGKAVEKIEDLEKSLAKLPDGAVKQSLQTFLNNAAGDVTHFTQDVSRWYDGVMDRASEMYKSHCHLATFLCGLVLAVSLNVDTIRITQTLMVEQNLRGQIADTAAAMVDIDPAKSKIDDHMEDAAGKLFALGLPIGWLDNGPITDKNGAIAKKNPSIHDYFSSRGLTGSILVVIGWLLTAIASAFGAPFWFNALQRILPLRGGGGSSSGSGGKAISASKS